MDKLKSMFKRKKAGGTAGTQTETPKTPGSAPQAAATNAPATDTTAAPSTSDPTVAPAGAAPVDAPK